MFFGVWIVKWYCNWLWNISTWYAMGHEFAPWWWQLFIGPKHKIYAFFMISIDLFDLIRLFLVCWIYLWIVKTENLVRLCKIWKNRSWSWIENLIDLRSKDCSLRWRVAQRSGSRFPGPIKAPGRNRKHHCITILINCARYRSFVYYLSGWDTLRCFYSHLVDPSNACAD